MLSDNIRNYRKKHSMSQDELADKLGVSRQSVSLWENDQTQPTIDNIVAMAKIFNISSDMLLNNTEISENAFVSPKPEAEKKSVNKKLIISLGISAAVVVIAAVVAISIFLSKNDTLNALVTADNSSTTSSALNTAASAKSTSSTATKSTNKTTGNKKKTGTSKSANTQTAKSTTASNKTSGDASAASKTETAKTSSAAPTSAQFDLFSYCKNFAIEKGELNGDYSIYQQPSSNYGGYENEYFSITYWGDSNMVEFCLHCPLDETLSHNFYIRMRGGYNHKYEYLSSKYYRDNGESLRSATGYIDPSVFSDSYPISCDDYQGSSDGQDTFMEDTRVGICDLINCLKKFVEVENMDCDFSDFEFANF